MADSTDHKTRNPQQKDSSLFQNQDYSMEEPSVVVGNHFSRLCLGRSFDHSTTVSIPNFNSSPKPMKKRSHSESPPIPEPHPKKEKLSLPPTPPLRRCISDFFNFSPIPPFHSLLDSSSKSPPDEVAVAVAPPQPPPTASTNYKPPFAASIAINNNNINSKGALRRTVSDPNPSPCPAPKTISRASSSSSSSSSGGDDDTSSHSKRLRRIKNRVRELSLWFQKVLDDEGHDEEDDQHQQEVANDQNLCNYHSNSTSTEDDEAERKFEETMGAERMGEGIVIHFRCHCGVPYQFLVAGGNCYYKLM